MRCPKCHYLSFDPEPRCKNCGYDLEVDDADLALRTAERTDVPVPDLKLHARSHADESPVALELVPAAPSRASRVRVQADVAVHTDVYVDPEVEDDLRVIDVNADVAGLADINDVDDSSDVKVAVEGVEVVEREAVAPRLSLVEESPAVPPVLPDEVRRVPFRAPHTTTEMPLFVRGIADRDDLPDEDILRGRFAAQVSVVPAAPRPPLAVRRTAPEPTRARPKPADRRLGPLDHDLLEDLKRVEREEAMQARAELQHAVEDEKRVEPIHRVGAAAVDVAVLGGIAGFVFWATLRLCNVSLWDLGPTALAPLLLFLVLMDVGYLLLFTAAGGQTVGKMLMGLRVVSEPADAGHDVPLGQAAFRSAMTLVSIAGLGLGWLPAFFGQGLTLHDRVTHTRVVRV